jgi:hypothetical protein
MRRLLMTLIGSVAIVTAQPATAQVGGPSCLPEQPDPDRELDDDLIGVGPFDFDDRFPTDFNELIALIRDYREMQAEESGQNGLALLQGAGNQWCLPRDLLGEARGN